MLLPVVHERDVRQRVWCADLDGSVLCTILPPGSSYLPRVSGLVMTIQNSNSVGDLPENNVSSDVVVSCAHLSIFLRTLLPIVELSVMNYPGILLCGIWC